jgi:hypothetical protein
VLSEFTVITAVDTLYNNKPPPVFPYIEPKSLPFPFQKIYGWPPILFIEIPSPFTANKELLNV